jgi:hypothetical protein
MEVANMGRRALVTLAVVLTAAALAAGCAHQPGVGEEWVVERSGRQPGWVKAAEPVVEAKDSWLFRGLVTHAANLEMGLRAAEADAKKRLVGQITELVEAEYTQYATASGTGQPAQFVAEGISWASQGVAVSGARPAQTYWERVAVGLPSGLEYYWRVWCLLEIGREDFERARKAAAAALEERRRQGSERQAEEEARRLRERLEGR